MIKVLAVDDSVLVRQVIAELVSRERDLELTGAASDPIHAMEMMKKTWPDVIVLDIEMPRMDGLTFLKQLMGQRPTPVVICSSVATEGAKATIEALAAGAVSVIAKPSLGVRAFLEDRSSGLLSAIREASQARVNRLVHPSLAALNERSKLSPDAMLSPPKAGAVHSNTERIVALGTSTGGTQALEVVLRQLPRNCPGLVIVQHMPEKFTETFAQRLDNLSEINVREARHGDRVLTGQALIAPGGKHLMLKRSGNQYSVDVMDGPLISRHRPSVDVLFRSVAKAAGHNATGIIMTGMGDDGAKGLKEMFDAGAYTAAQDQESCVVFGMPKEAIKMGGAKTVVSLDAIPKLIMQPGKV